MVEKYIVGHPYKTDSIIDEGDDCKVVWVAPDDRDSMFWATDDNFLLSVQKIGIIDDKPVSIRATWISVSLKDDTKVYGLGLQLGGIDKRGRVYKSFCTDDPLHTEDKHSLYGAHNFVVIKDKDGEDSRGWCFGLFIDYPGEITFDIAHSDPNRLFIRMDKDNVNIYCIKEKSVKDVVHKFRTMIGKSYIAPFWAFGFMQSRWGYASESDIMDVYNTHQYWDLPLDAIFLDIDYMDGFRDFTYNKSAFSNYSEVVQGLLEKGVHVVPIIDAGIKAEESFPIDKEGVENNYYCKKADGSDFLAAVWPGLAHFPDVTQEAARKWFGGLCKKFLVDNNLSGFWLDMNEPAIFYSKDGLESFGKKLEDWGRQCSAPTGDDVITWQVKGAVLGIQNSMDDYKSFYHKVKREEAGGLGDDNIPCDDEKSVFVCHDLIHNLYGYLLTKGVSEALIADSKEKDCDNKECEPPLLISRASFIGSHRYSGIWTGDNCSWWSHILLCLKQLPSLNMVGYLYTGCDLGGFGDNTNRELLLRFLALGVWTPLMRNHSAAGTRRQECYEFGDTGDFELILSFRYRILPYIYGEYCYAAENYEMYFRPLSFDYSDEEAQNCEDQLMLGRDLMIAPVYQANAVGRTVYLPEDMTCITASYYTGCVTGEPKTQVLKKGVHWVHCAVDEVVFFIKKGHKIPICKPAMNTKELDRSVVEYWGE